MKTSGNVKITNPCKGKYPPSLDVKITNICNASCKFCIERGGYSPAPAPVDRLIQSAISSSAQDVLVLGGEPTLYPDLEVFLREVSKFKKVYMTTNGSTLHSLVSNSNIMAYLSGINISIHHYDERKNNQIYGVNNLVSFSKLSEAIKRLSYSNVPSRINTCLVKGGIENRRDAMLMIGFAAGLGANSIRFAELQGVSDESYVDARHVFRDINNNPYSEGCEQVLSGYPIEVVVRTACGFVNPHREKPDLIHQPTSKVSMMYTDGNIYSGWIQKESSPSCHQTGDRFPSCHGSGSSSTSCHGYREPMGCH